MALFDEESVNKDTVSNTEDISSNGLSDCEESSQKGVYTYHQVNIFVTGFA